MIIVGYTIAVVFTVLVTIWIALIVESLAGTGPFEPYFATELDFHCPPENDDEVILDSRFTFVDSNGEEHTSPAGMWSDGASVGQLMPWPIIGWLARWAIGGTPLTGPFRPAAVPHDGIYATAKESSFWRALISLRRAVGDRVIYEAARCRRYILKDGRRIERKPASWLRAFVVMAILRIAGFKAWMDDSSKAQRSIAKLM